MMMMMMMTTTTTTVFVGVESIQSSQYRVLECGFLEAGDFLTS
jgi:hypothetical protein